MKAMLIMHFCSGIIAGYIHLDINQTGRQSRFLQIYHVKQNFGGQDLIPFSMEAQFINNRNALEGYCRRGWSEFLQRWSQLKLDIDKKDFISKVFDCDHGYYHALNAIASFQESTHIDAENVLTKVLSEPCAQDMFTDQRISPQQSKMLGEFTRDVIRVGWQRVKTVEPEEVQKMQQTNFWTWFAGILLMEIRAKDIGDLRAFLVTNLTMIAKYLSDLGIEKAAIENFVNNLSDYTDPFF